jgi:hypothetical protein
MALEIMLAVICVIGLYVCWSIAQFNTAAKKERKRTSAPINYVDVPRGKTKRKKKNHKWT